MSQPETRPQALNLIVAYKLARAAFSMLAAVVLAGLAIFHVTPHLGELVHQFHAHAVSQLSLMVSSALLEVLVPKHLWVVIGGLALDGVLVCFEGWSLWRGKSWGPWLVVGATSMALPFEVVAIVRHQSIARVAVLVLNALIVAYLLARTVRERRAAR